MNGTEFTGRLALTLVFTLACSDNAPPQVCEPACEPFGADFPGVGECVQGTCSPTFLECFESTEHSTCASQCQAAGSTCVENGCAEGTYLIQSNLQECQDPDALGVVVERACDEPIDWQGNTGARCCCEQ